MGDASSIPLGQWSHQSHSNPLCSQTKLICTGWPFSLLIQSWAFLLLCPSSFILAYEPFCSSVQAPSRHHQHRSPDVLSSFSALLPTPYQSWPTSSSWSSPQWSCLMYRFVNIVNMKVAGATANRVKKGHFFWSKESVLMEKKYLNTELFLQLKKNVFITTCLKQTDFYYISYDEKILQNQDVYWHCLLKIYLLWNETLPQSFEVFLKFNMKEKKNPTYCRSLTEKSWRFSQNI